MAVRRGLDLPQAWTMSSSRVCWKPPPWWVVGLKFKRGQSQSQGQAGFFLLCLRHHCPISGWAGAWRAGPGSPAWSSCFPHVYRHSFLGLGCLGGLRACNCNLVLVSPWCAFFSLRPGSDHGVGSHMSWPHFFPSSTWVAGSTNWWQSLHWIQPHSSRVWGHGVGNGPGQVRLVPKLAPFLPICTFSLAMADSIMMAISTEQELKPEPSAGWGGGNTGSNPCKLARVPGSFQ